MLHFLKFLHKLLTIYTNCHFFCYFIQHHDWSVLFYLKLY